MPACSREQATETHNHTAPRGRPPSHRPSSVSVGLCLDDLLEASELLALVEIDERDALRRATHLAYRLHARANQHAAGGDEDDLVVWTHERGGDHLSVALGLRDGD